MDDNIKPVSTTVDPIPGVLVPGSLPRWYDADVAAIHIPYSIEQDEDGWFCAYAPFVTDEVHGGANGAGRTPEEAVADLREALAACVAQYGTPHSAKTIVTLTAQDAA